MHIVITGTGFGFPDGTGATSRVLALAKGLAENGATVEVFMPKPSENERSGERNANLKGTYEGIRFEYTCGQRLASRTRWGALFLYLKGLWRACRAIHKSHRIAKVDAILLWYPENLISFFVFRALATLIGASLIAEKCEFPFVYSHKTIRVRATMWFNDHVTYRMLDGVIVISEYLWDFFSARVSAKAKLIHVPILVDMGEFDIVADNLDRVDKRIMYCGNLDNEGEVKTLLQSFALVAGHFPKWMLHVIGDVRDEAQNSELTQLIVNIGLHGRVVLLGHHPRREIPRLLVNGDIMALPRADGVFSRAGFPTKVGEYLATGKPVVVTRIGEVDRYLEDHINAYLVPPGNIRAFADALQCVMANPEEAQEVGQRGREVAQRAFSCQTHGKRIIEYIRALR